MTSVELFKAEAIVNLDQWRASWGNIGFFERTRPWIYGDLFLKGRDFLELENGRYYTWQELSGMIYKLIPSVGMEPKTLLNWALIAHKFSDKKNRLDSLSWSHHREVVEFPMREAMSWLRKAESKQWSVEDLRQAIAEKNGSRCEGPPIARFVPRRVVADQVRWFRQQFDDEPLEDWPAERRAALKKEYEPLLEILSKL